MCAQHELKMTLETDRDQLETRRLPAKSQINKCKIKFSVDERELS